MTSTCKQVSHSSRGRSDLTYVFHAPDISINTSRLSVTLASVWYCLIRASKTFPLKKPPNHPHTVPPCL